MMGHEGVSAESKTQIDDAGKLVRDYLKGEIASGKTELQAAFLKIGNYRDEFGPALESVTNSLRSALQGSAATGSAPSIASRPKTLIAIGLKLYKISSRLTQIEDIAGCRVVLPAQADVNSFLALVQKLWPEAKIEDKTARPNASGYRAIHVIVVEGGKKVEIQLRTARQHRWADAVENWGSRLGIDQLKWNLKDGQGPEDLVLYFKLAADRLARLDAGKDPDPVLEKRFEQLREEVRHYFRDSKKVNPTWAN